MRELLNKGGPVSWVLLLGAFCCACLIVERTLYFISTKLAPGNQARRMRELALQLRAQGASRQESLDKLQELAARLQHEMQRGLWFLHFSAAAAPSLGLLGTTLGLIRSFRELARSGHADIQALSGGIWEAMLSTAIGLLLAIPALFFHSYFSKLIEDRVLEMGLAVPVGQVRQNADEVEERELPPPADGSSEENLRCCP